MSKAIKTLDGLQTSLIDYLDNHCGNDPKNAELLPNEMTRRGNIESGCKTLTQKFNLFRYLAAYFINLDKYEGVERRWLGKSDPLPTTLYEVDGHIDEYDFNYSLSDRVVMQTNFYSLVSMANAFVDTLLRLIYDLHNEYFQARHTQINGEDSVKSLDRETFDYSKLLALLPNTSLLGKAVLEFTPSEYAFGRLSLLRNQMEHDSFGNILKIKIELDGMLEHGTETVSVHGVWGFLPDSQPDIPIDNYAKDLYALMAELIDRICTVLSEDPVGCIEEIAES